MILLSKSSNIFFGTPVILLEYLYNASVVLLRLPKPTKVFLLDCFVESESITLENLRLLKSLVVGVAVYFALMLIKIVGSGKSHGADLTPCGRTIVAVLSCYVALQIGCQISLFAFENLMADRTFHPATDSDIAGQGARLFGSSLGCLGRRSFSLRLIPSKVCLYGSVINKTQAAYDPAFILAYGSIDPNNATHLCELTDEADLAKEQLDTLEWKLPFEFILLRGKSPESWESPVTPADG